WSRCTASPACRSRRRPGYSACRAQAPTGIGLMPAPGCSVSCTANPPARNRENFGISWDKLGPGVALLPRQVLLTRRAMNVDPARVRAIFLEAVEKHPPDTWDQFVDAACTGDAELGRQVALLLDAHRQAGSFLIQGAVAPARMVDQTSVQEAP